LGADPEYSGAFDVHHPHRLFFLGSYLVLVGDTESDRVVCIVRDGKVKRRICVPLGTSVFPGVDGKIGYARSTHRGLERGRLHGKTRFSEDGATEHSLYTGVKNVLGWTEYGAVVWALEDGAAISFSLLDLNVGTIHRSGEWVAVGTVGGVVGLIDMRTPSSRKMPFLTKAHDAPIHSIAFSSRGRWFATAGDRVQLWSWEASEAP
jgi:hypothetical protein